MAILCWFFLIRWSCIVWKYLASSRCRSVRSCHRPPLGTSFASVSAGAWGWVRISRFWYYTQGLLWISQVCRCSITICLFLSWTVNRWVWINQGLVLLIIVVYYSDVWRFASRATSSCLNHGAILVVTLELLIGWGHIVIILTLTHGKWHDDVCLWAVQAIRWRW